MQRRPTIDMAPGERYDILIDFRNFNVGDTLYLRNTFSEFWSFDLPDVMQFRVVSGTTPSFSIPTSSIVPYSFPTSSDTTRTFALVAPMMGQMHMMGGSNNPLTIAGAAYDPNVANLQVRKGDTETWIFQSNMMSMLPHPMHLHLVQFHINGVSSGSLEDGWKDIVMVPTMGQRSITATFDGAPGIYMLHCHNLVHEDWDMMLQYEICDDTDPSHLCNARLLNAFTDGSGMGGYFDTPSSSTTTQFDNSQQQQQQHDNELQLTQSSCFSLAIYCIFYWAVLASWTLLG